MGTDLTTYKSFFAIKLHIGSILNVGKIKNEGNYQMLRQKKLEGHSPPKLYGRSVLTINNDLLHNNCYMCKNWFFFWSKTTTMIWKWRWGVGVARIIIIAKKKENTSSNEKEARSRWGGKNPVLQCTIIFHVKRRDVN